MRIDAHQHFWRYDPAVHSFIDERMPILQRDYLPQDLKPELDGAGLSGCVAVQAPQTLEETRFLLQLAGENEFIRAVVGWVDLRAPDLKGTLEELGEHPRLRGIRHIVQEEPDGFLEDESFRRGVAELGRHNLVYDMLVYERQLPQASRFMAQLPDVTFVLDHLGKPRMKEPNLKEFVNNLSQIARIPNIFCKISGLVTEADWGSWTPEQLRPFLQSAVELFGPERLLFGSDWPVCLLAASYDQVHRVVDDYFREFSQSERAGLFGENAVRAYGIEA